MQYPTPSEVEQSLKLFAEEIGDTTDSPFCVAMVARHGGKAPVYSVVIRGVDQEPIRKKLAEVLNRRFSLGGTSLALDANEAQVISQYRRAAFLNTAPIRSPLPSVPAGASAMGEGSRGKHAILTSIAAACLRITVATRWLLQSQSVLRRCSPWARNAFSVWSSLAIRSQGLNPRKTNDAVRSASSYGRTVKA
jgi:hypothetical protein